MGPVDIGILALVAVLVALCVRHLVRSGRDGCSSCGSREGCSARAAGGTCSAAEDMLRRAERALGERPRG
ncbi:hypothetical protein [Olsenella sp. An290]|uniref:hypothetical protein n=1 Tax=Olsenella sp. An290 TaxID=1965625 RepID=UPI000B372F41|nr:hypothetical protein [Olsenella sp. An290]OUO34238.1 hypothetical protein B5F84_07225 [Olsenella sp. An290]